MKIRVLLTTLLHSNNRTIINDEKKFRMDGDWPLNLIAFDPHERHFLLSLLANWLSDVTCEWHNELTFERVIQ